MARALVNQLAPLRARFVSSAAQPLALILLIVGVLAVSAGWSGKTYQRKGQHKSNHNGPYTRRKLA